MEKKLWYYTKNSETLVNDGKNYDTMEKNYGTMENNYGTMEKNYGTMEKLWFYS